MPPPCSVSDIPEVTKRTLLLGVIEPSVLPILCQAVSLPDISDRTGITPFPVWMFPCQSVFPPGIPDCFGIIPFSIWPFPCQPVFPPGISVCPGIPAFSIPCVPDVTNRGGRLCQSGSPSHIPEDSSCLPCHCPSSC